VRSRVVHRDSISIPREGAAQIAFVGPPNAGKSSLLQALSQIQIKTGDYAFTTTRPVAALTRIRGVLVQLVEIPGLIDGATEDRGGGRALLGVLRSADGLVLCHDCCAPEELDVIRRELDLAGIQKPSLVVATKTDEQPAPPGDVRRVDPRRRQPRRAARPIWQLTGLIRVFLRRPGHDEAEPQPLHPPATVADVARTIHNEVEAACTGARIWGPSARFDAQRVGRDHVVEDGDTIEVLVR
jgi:small GTP-binding protein